MLLDAFAESKPDIVLIEMYPFGRRQFRFELLPLLEQAAAARPKPLVAVSVRDILVDKGRMDRAREAVDIIKHSVDRVLVHGDPRLTRFDLTFPMAAEIADRLSYTGFVVERQAPNAALDRGKGEILVSAGGGAVGFALLSAAIRAKRMTRHRQSSVAHRPPAANLPGDQRKELDKLAAGDADVTIDSYRSDFRRLDGRLSSLHLAGRLQHRHGTDRVEMPGGGGALCRGRRERADLARAHAGRTPGAGHGRSGIPHPRHPGGGGRCGARAGGTGGQSRRRPAKRRRADRRLAAKDRRMTDWDDLARECEAWAAAGRVAELWWRDDDAVADTPALRRLLALAEGRAPIALAVIPATLTPSLAPLLAAEGKNVSVLQHGYDHGNRAAEGAKKSEFPQARPAAEVRATLAAGRDRLRDQFAARFVPAFTPPWNRFDPRHLSVLPELGYRGTDDLSAAQERMGPRRASPKSTPMWT